jgi:putative nucleotidyltransferase with HDIG domain
MNDLIREVRDLPPLPAIVSELLQSMDQENLDSHTLAAKLARDPALSAKTLRLANSSFYGMSTRITTIAQAVSVLGMHSLRTLITACAITGSFAAPTTLDFDFPAFWRHAIATAAAARTLAPPARQDPDTAFLAGLLHDLGTLVLVTCRPEAYRAVLAYQRAHDCLSTPAQQAVFGTDHAAIGSALAAHWKFPASIQAAVADHHRDAPGYAADAALPLPALIALADTLAHALDLAGLADEQAPALALPLWQALPLDDAGWSRVFHDTEQLFHDMCQTLSP